LPENPWCVETGASKSEHYRQDLRLMFRSEIAKVGINRSLVAKTLNKACSASAQHRTKEPGVNEELKTREKAKIVNARQD
jgi:hypothetical protein